MIRTLKEKPIPSQPAAVVHEFDDDRMDGDEAQMGRGGRGLCAPVGQDALDLEDEAMSRVKLALPLLWNAQKLASRLAEDPWEFSVEWPELRQAGLTCNEGRWLIHRGLAKHAKEVTSATDEWRRFVPYASLALSERTCLVLTDEGCRFACQIESCGNAAANGRGVEVAGPVSRELINGFGYRVDGAHGRQADGGEGAVVTKPRGDRDRRQLRVGLRVVKEFKVPASNQEIILAVFEEEEWPAKIDDPLPRNPQIDPQRRLHDTINSLNRNQRHQLLHFGADGLGRGVRWELVRKQPL
jgi:hypothetical protein